MRIELPTHRQEKLYTFLQAWRSLNNSGLIVWGNEDG